MIKVDLKPLSVNEAWQGKRYKTKKYKRFERDLSLMLPKITLPRPPYKIYLEFGFSSKLNDWDNPIKPVQDILQKKYQFNDREVYDARVIKKIVPPGKEYIKFELSPL